MKNTYRVDGDTVYIQGKCKGNVVEFTIDLDDLEKVKAFKNTWHIRLLNNDPTTRYVYGQTWVGRKACNVGLHRYVTDAKQGFDVDHIDGDGLNNTKSNLRVVTHAVNCANTRVSKNNTSGVTGVGWFKQYGQWRARTVWQGKEHHLGYFDNKEEAVRAVKHFKELHGIIHRG